MGKERQVTESLTLTIPTGEWLSANQRLHWAQKARRTRSIRTRAFLLARTALHDGDVTHHAGRTLVHALIGYSTKHKADPPNSYPTIKACIDGLVDAGVFPEDTSDHVVLSFDRDRKKADKGAYRVTLMFIDQEVPF